MGKNFFLVFVVDVFLVLFLGLLFPAEYGVDDFFFVVATVPTLVYQLGLIWPIFGPCGVGW